eukprot:363733_1
MNELKYGKMNVNNPYFHSINHTIKTVVSYYCKSIQHDIPLEILHLILLYYYVGYKFYRYGQDVDFSDKSIKKTIPTPDYSLCVFGETIDCIYSFHHNFIYNLHIKWTTAVHSFYMGYIASSIHNIRDWNDGVGTRLNKNNSLGILVTKDCKKFKFSHLFSQGNEIISNDSKSSFKANDIFVLSFNFGNKELIIKHNNVISTKISIENYNKITPAFALFYKNEQIEIIKYEFISNENKT